jgi:hypothetical protein
MEVETSLPKIKSRIEASPGTWKVYRCDVGKVDLAKLVAVLRRENYEVGRDNELTLEVGEDGKIRKA